MDGEDLRCSTWARDAHLEPIGSIGYYAGFLLVEWDGPWPRDFGDKPALTPVVTALRGTGIRLQGLIPLDDRRRLVLYRRNDPSGFAGYHRADTVVDGDGPEALEQAVMTLLAGPPGEPSSVPEVLVCTHGRRDTCCGSRGTRLALELAAGDAGDAGLVQWRRTSHTGGHRFAPTAIVLPEGTAWAYADADLLRRVVRRQGPLAPLLARYRGCAGLESAPIQALERAVLAEVGWDLLDRPRWGTQLGKDRVRLEARAADGSVGVWEATVRVGRQLPIAECGATLTDDPKTTIEWRVDELRVV